MQNLARFRTTSKFGGEYFRSGWRYSKSDKYFIYCDSSCVSNVWIVKNQRGVELFDGRRPNRSPRHRQRGGWRSHSRRVCVNRNPAHPTKHSTTVGWGDEITVVGRDNHLTRDRKKQHRQDSAQNVADKITHTRIIARILHHVSYYWIN